MGKTPIIGKRERWDKEKTRTADVTTTVTAACIMRAATTTTDNAESSDSKNAIATAITASTTIATP